MTSDKAIDLLRRLARFARARTVPPFEFVVAHPDEELAAAWRMRVQTVGSTTTAEYMVDIASVVAPSKTLDVLVEALRGVLRDGDQSMPYAPELRALLDAGLRPGAAAARLADEIEAIALANDTLRMYDTMRAATAARMLVQHGLRDSPGMILYNIAAAHGWLAANASYSEREAANHAFQRAVAARLRRVVPVPTWARLLGGR